MRDARDWPLLLFCIKLGEPDTLSDCEWYEPEEDPLDVNMWSISVDPRTGLAWTWCRD